MNAGAAANFAASSVQVSFRSFRHVLIVAARRARANLRLNRLETEPPVAEEFPVSSLLSHVILENRSEATERLRALRTRSVSVDKRHTETIIELPPASRATSSSHLSPGYG